MNLHANSVAIGTSGVLILGASGSGKSALSLQLMSLGAVLVSDDRTDLSVENGTVWARAPSTLSGLIEARGIGILLANHQEATPVHLVIDLDQVETERFPTPHHARVLDVKLPCLHSVKAPHFPAAILQYVLAGPKVST